MDAPIETRSLPPLHERDARAYISEQLFLAAEISERADVGQREIEAELVFVADRSQGKAAVFDAQAAAVPVVGGLHRRILQKAQIGVEAQVGRSTESTLVGLPVAEQHTELIERLLRRVRGSIAGRRQICISATDGVTNRNDSSRTRCWH